MSKQTSHTSKNSRSKNIKNRKPNFGFGLIIDFCLIINDIFKEEIITEKTENCYPELLNQLEKSQRQLVELLLHHLVKLHQINRVQKANKVFEISGEDVLTALKIIEKLELHESQNRKFLSRKERLFYIKLQENFSDKLFTSRDLQQFFSLGKSLINKNLNLFFEENLIERFGYNNKGYYYKLLKVNDLNTNITEENLSLEEEIREEFSDIRTSFYQ